VAVGLTEVDPIPNCELKLPGEIEMVVAPLADQLSVLLPPEVMLVGLAPNEPIDGTETVPPVELPEPLDPVVPVEPDELPEPEELPEPVDVPDPAVDVFVGLAVWPQAARLTQSSRAEISGPRESGTNRMATLAKGDRIVGAPHCSLALAPIAAILATRTELVAVPDWGQGQVDSLEGAMFLELQTMIFAQTFQRRRGDIARLFQIWLHLANRNVLHTSALYSD
jgi:hypothetical protein